MSGLRISSGNITPFKPNQLHATVVNYLSQVRDRAMTNLRPIPPSQISEFYLWKTGDKDLRLADKLETRRVLAELSREDTLFNIALNGESLSLGLIKLKEGERVNHLDITAPFKSGPRFVGNTRTLEDGSSDIMISPSNSLIYLLGPDYKKTMFDGCIRTARFFIENGFPWWIKIHESMRFDFQTLSRHPYDPIPVKTVLDLARKPLHSEIPNREGTSEQTGS